LDKNVTFAVAGSGKTAGLVERLTVDRRALLITYTNNTYEDLRRRVIDKFGCLPANITINGYFTFLNRFCYRPYLFNEVRERGISFESPSQYTRGFQLTDVRRYLDGGRRIYHCRMAKLLDARGFMPDLLRRMERYFDDVFVDEVQDFGGHDFNFLLQLSRARVGWTLVGDFYQYTYSTSHDGNVNNSLHDDYEEYRQRFAKAGFRVDAASLSHSHRCAEAVCTFIRDHIGIDIRTASSQAGSVTIVDNQSVAERLHADPAIVKLFLQKHESYGCHALTWGGAKGLDQFNDVCVVLNKTTLQKFHSGELNKLAPITRNKLYVACSRTRRNLYLVPEIMFNKFKISGPQVAT
jgi:DNA helicase II / ATP-dependent DNA helicase PcrA